ncbi:hypothetical protein KUCAC02_015579 [Chaenocephalus aceratus]|uniref:Uncharacterized protein n=1 Tax=Chaenocephalus aceratus TaxID=36190 RepID=A0ACB9XZ33_CHAAC|nr:hypothetical protein KUCAC02_015579 [Chaenocephalus aceratus]
MVDKLLLGILDDLGKDAFQDFKWYLSQKNLDGVKPIPVSKLEDASRGQTVTRMTRSYGEKTTVEVAVEILKKISNRKAAAELRKKYAAIQADETTDISTHCQLVLVLRYIDPHNNVQERFLEFIPLQNANADTVATALMERLGTILPDGQQGKLIAQAYDGCSG